MKMTENLKRCPFCGGTANIAKGQIEFWAYCPHCGAQTELYETEQEVEKAWNSRPIENELESENKRLREALQMIATEKDNHGQWLSVEQAAQIAKDTLTECGL